MNVSAELQPETQDESVSASDAPIQRVTNAEVDAAIRIDQSVTMVRLAPLMMISNVSVPLILQEKMAPLESVTAGVAHEMQAWHTKSRTR